MTKGKVKSVNVKVGDQVKKGQTLATITTDDLDDQVQQAKINLDDAKQALQDLLDGYNLELEYLQQKANYDALLLKQKTINQDHALALLDLQQQIESAKQTVKDKEKVYTDTKADYEELLSGSNSATADLALSSTVRTRNTTFQTLVFDLKTIVLNLQTSLDAYDQILELTDTYRYANSSQKIYIGAKNANLRNQSETLFRTLSNQVNQLASGYATLEAKAVQNLTEEEVVRNYGILKEIGNTMMNRGSTNYEMFKASIDNASLTQSQIDKYAGDFGTTVQTNGARYIQQYSAAVDKLATLKEDTSLEDTKLKMEKAFTDREKAKTSLEKLELSVEVKLADQEKEKADLTNNIDTTQRNITKIQGGQSLNESRIKQARNTVTQRQNSLKTLQDKYSDYKLEANFDGVITQMDIQVGDSIEQSTNATQRYIYVENNNLLEMTLSVEQVDIVKLKEGMEVVVYLDSYPSSSYRGLITEINTVPASSQGIATYQVNITFEKNFPEEVILAGMGGNAKIITSQTKNVMVVPNQAISRKDGQSVVKLLENGVWVDRVVEI
jgi:multidrug efflux pump subunit AcrA (membrane-fusion protein)